MAGAAGGRVFSSGRSEQSILPQSAASQN